MVEEHSITGSSQTLVRTHTWGTDLGGSLQGAGGVGGLLLTEEISGSSTTAYHFHYGGNGNVTEITNNTGSSAASYRYDAFGNTLVASGPYATQNRYRFSTKPLDGEVATAPLYYYGYRYYDPVTGRWPSRDPIEEEGGINLYGFVGNDSVNKWDVLGLEECYEVDDATERNKCCCVAILSLLIGGVKSKLPEEFSAIYTYFVIAAAIITLLIIIIRKGLIRKKR